MRPALSLLSATALGVLLVAGLAGGCGADKPKTAAEALGVPPPPGPTPTKLEDALLSDPCLDHMHDVAGAMLMYYALHKQLPTALGDIASVQDITGPVDLTCPVSKQPFVFDPVGLHTLGGRNYIVVYEATVAHSLTGPAATTLGGGTRHVIITPEGATGNNRTFEVVTMPEGIFKTYNLKIPQ